jgi:hypothetical protein
LLRVVVAHLEQQDHLAQVVVVLVDTGLEQAFL